MLPSFAALDLRRTVAPTGVVLGPRAVERRVQYFKGRFRRYAVGEPLSTSDDNFMDSELDLIQESLANEGPAELKLIAAIAEKQPDANGQVAVEADVVMDAQSEFADKEIMLQVLREMWSLEGTRSHLARKLVERDVLEAMLGCLNDHVLKFAQDLRYVVLTTLYDLTSRWTGNLIVRLVLVVTENKANALVPILCSFVNTMWQTETAMTNTMHAMWLLLTLADDSNGFTKTWDNPSQNEVDDVGWARSYYGLEDGMRTPEGQIYEPYEQARRAIKRTDGALERVIATCEYMRMMDGLEHASIRIDASSFAIGVLEDLLYSDVVTVTTFFEYNGLERLLRAYYWLTPTSYLRGSILRIVNECLLQACLWVEVPAAIARFQAALPGLFTHWLQAEQAQGTDWRPDTDNIWELMHGVAQVGPLKDMLLRLDDSYTLLRRTSDANIGKGRERVYDILAYALKAPTPWQVWDRFTNRDGGDYWAETIIDDVVSYGQRNPLPSVPNWKLRTVAVMLENKHSFTGVCMVRLPDETMRELVQPFALELYKGNKGPEDAWKNALASLAANGMLWNTISKEIEKHQDEEDWGAGDWSLVVGVLNDDDVLAQAAVSDPYPSAVAALVLLHKLNEAHAELLSTRPLSPDDRALLKQRQEQYEPVLEAIENEHVGRDERYGAILQKAVDFARKLLAFPSLQNPQQDALREQFNDNKRKRPDDDDAGPSTSTEAPVGSGAAFVSLLAYVSR